MRQRVRQRRTQDCSLVENLEGRILMSGNMPAKLPARWVAQPTTQIAAAGRRFHRETTPDLTSAALITMTDTTSAPLAGTSALPGDCNADWKVDSVDLNIVAGNWLATSATWSMGDFTGDGIVNAYDLNVLSANWLATVTPPAPTPTVSYDWHTQTINGILNVWAPNPGDFGSHYTVSDPSKLFGPDGIPNIEGVHQGPIGNCYFLSAIGGTALDRPGAIMNMVKDDGTGGWSVTFQWKNPSGVSVPVTFHTSKELSTSMQTEANGEVWSLVMEKAYAAFRTFNGVSSTNTFASTSWGYAGDAERYIGQAYGVYYTAGQSEQNIYNQLAGARSQSRPVLFHTSSTAPSMVASHVYAITSVFVDASGQKEVTTYNPWGFYETRTLTDLMRNTTGQVVIAV
jgi:hypothetical protein